MARLSHDTRRMKMKDKEMAEEYVDTLLAKDDAELDKFLDEYLGDLRLTKKQAGAILGIIKGVGIGSYLAGLEAGKEIEKEYVKNNAFTSMKEQGLFPFGKWHDLQKNPTDVPKENVTVLLLTEVEPVTARYDNKYEAFFRLNDKLDYCIFIAPMSYIAWCEIPQYTEE